MARSEPGLRPILTGTMGWSYDDWRGVFYTRDVPAARMLNEYARVFDTIELDTTFFGTPRPSTLDGWASAVPPGFLFSAKAPKAITHERRLRNASEAALEFGVLLRDRLGAKLGALLLQLPPDLTADERPALDTFITEVTSPRREPGLPWVVEFRDTSWLETDIAEALAAQNVRVATTERLDLGVPIAYLRLLGTEGSVARFDARQFDRSSELDTWAARLDTSRRDTGASPAPDSPPPPILAYARNFFEGHSPATLMELRRRLSLPLPTPPGQQQMALF